MMTFEETTQFLYKQLPVFQHKGKTAYKPGLGNTIALDEYFGFPHKSYKTIHIGGTNGKGSTSHSLAAILQKAGYKVGLYTSPHLVDFRERIRVNGEMISKQYVIDFVENNFKDIEHIHPSFFELTMMMAFCYFREMNVDYAIIEVGLGGRLDSTNVIDPVLSVITNISFDHVQFLGDTLEKIAIEKAGIIKPEVPVIIGETTNENIREIFISKAKECNSEITFAEELFRDITQGYSHGKTTYFSNETGELESELGGEYHINNIRTILSSVKKLREGGIIITDEALKEGLSEVCTLTGLRGRWEKLSECPLTYCDTGHNIGGFTYLSKKLKSLKCDTLRIVIGMVNDKDISEVLSLLPKEATYYFTQANIERALPASDLKNKAEKYGLSGKDFFNVPDAYNTALKESSENDFIFIGGSNFTVGDLLLYLENSKNK